MRIITAAIILAAASPALGQEANNAATAAPETANVATAPATDVTMTNEVLAPGEATTAVPVEPVAPEPVYPEPVRRDSGGGFPWGLLGLLGLVGLLGRARASRDT